MKLSLLIFCLVCVCVTTAQRCSIRKGYYRGNTVNGMKVMRDSTMEFCKVLCYKEPTCNFWDYDYERKYCLLRTEHRGHILFKYDLFSGNKACGAPGSAGNCLDCIKEPCPDCLEACTADPEGPACVFCILAICLTPCGNACIP